MNVDNFVEKLKSLRYKPDIVLLHRNVDLETMATERGEKMVEVTEWGNIAEIKEILGKGKRVAVAGGVTPDKVDMALTNGADIIVVGRYIIGSRDVRRAAEDFLAHMPQDPDTMRLALDEDESI